MADGTLTLDLDEGYIGREVERLRLVDDALYAEREAYRCKAMQRFNGWREWLAVAYGLLRAAADSRPGQYDTYGARILLKAASYARLLGWKREMQDLCDDARARSPLLEDYEEAERILNPEPRW